MERDDGLGPGGVQGLLPGLPRRSGQVRVHRASGQAALRAPSLAPQGLRDRGARQGEESDEGGHTD